MRLLDDVRLIESEVLAPPTAVTFECSIINKCMLPSCIAPNKDDSKIHHSIKSVPCSAWLELI